MPRKQTKSGQEAQKNEEMGIDVPPIPSISQILEEQATKGKPEHLPAKGKKIGRPTSFTQHIADIICIRISEGESLKSITQDEAMPDRATVYRWLAADTAFCDMYARAREDQADTLADEIMAIADETPDLNPILDKHGALIEIQLHSAYLQWQKQRIDARKWTAMKLKPRKYGDRMQVAGDPESPLEAKVDLGIFDTILKAVELKRQTESNVN